MINFIKSHCFTKRGGLNNRVTLKSWWDNKKFIHQYNQIHSLTKFLPESTKMSQRIWHVYNSIYITPSCKICKNKTNFKSFKDGYYATCSNKCATLDPDRSKKIVSNTNRNQVLDSMKQTNLMKYGVETYFQTKEFQNKTKKTKLNKYGDENYHNREKIEITNLSRYGSSTYFTSVEGRRTLEQKRIENNGSLKLSPEINKNLNDIEYLKELNKTLNVDEIADKIFVTPNSIMNKFTHNDYQWITHKRKTKLHTQESIYDFVSSLGFSPKWNDRKIIYPKEIDIYIPEKKLGIELNGLYWYSYNYIESKEDIYKHKIKLDMCNEKGVDLIQITDKEWNENKSIVKSIIRNKLSLYDSKVRASKCDIKEIDSKTAREFLQNNHIQGYAKSNVKIGLFNNKQLVYIMTFAKPRFSKKYEYELIRCASLLNTKVYGGASRILKYFTNIYSPKSIISYCDLSKFNGLLYESLGFNYSHTSNPSYFYFNNERILSRYSAQKHKIENILENFDSTKSEAWNMFNNGYRRYWNCGNSVYTLSRI